MLDFLINTAQAATLPTFNQSNLPAFISSVYSFALTIVGIAVFIRILHAGFLWLTAAGNASKATDAKNKIQNAVIGAILLFASYLILYIVNPDLVKNTLNFSLPRNNTSSLPGYEARTGATDGSAELNGCIGCLGQVSSKEGIPSAHAQSGIYAFTIRVTDANGDQYEQSYSMEVVEDVATIGNEQKHPLAGQALYNSSIARAAEVSLEISTKLIPDGINGRPYFARIIATGGAAPYVFEVVDPSGLPEGVYLQAENERPILVIENLTTHRSPPSVYYQTDRFRLTLSNSTANSTLFYKWQKNGQPWIYPGKTPDANGWVNFGQTNASGRWVNEAAFTSNEVGCWLEWAMVDGKVSNIISFEVVVPGGASACGGGVIPSPTPSGSQPPTPTPAPGGGTCLARGPISGPAAGKTCPVGQCWDGWLNTSSNPIVPFCYQIGSHPTIHTCPAGMIPDVIPGAGPGGGGIRCIQRPSPNFVPCTLNVSCEDDNGDPVPLPSGNTCESVGANYRVECYYPWQSAESIACDREYRRERESCVETISNLPPGGAPGTVNTSSLPSCDTASPGQACRTSDTAAHCRYSDPAGSGPNQDAFYCGALWSNLGTGYCQPGQTTNCYSAPNCANPQTIGERAFCSAQPSPIPQP